MATEASVGRHVGMRGGVRSAGGSALREPDAGRAPEGEPCESGKPSLGLSIASMFY